MLVIGTILVLRALTFRRVGRPTHCHDRAGHILGVLGSQVSAES